MAGDSPAYRGVWPTTTSGGDDYSSHPRMEKLGEGMTEEETVTLVPAVSLNFGEFLHWQRLEDGIIRIDNVIDDYTIVHLLDELLEVQRLGLPEITLVINSPGGGAYCALALYDALKDLQMRGITVNALVLGLAASAASSIVLQAATVRRASVNSRFMFHEVSQYHFGVQTTSGSEDSLKEGKAVQDVLVRILVTRTGRSEEDVLSLITRRETYMSAQEAKDWGIIDEVVE